MKKLTMIQNRRLVTSRGIEEIAGGVFIPKHNLTDSNICTTVDGQRIIKCASKGVEVGDHRYIVDEEDIIAIEHEGRWVPMGNWMLVRKCIDPEPEGGVITHLGKRATRFAEILAVGGKTMLEELVGYLAYITEGANPQKVEDTEDDWLVKTDDVLMAVKQEE
jgi:hypothetical protein